MKWTSRDTVYLSVIVVLSTVLAAATREKPASVYGGLPTGVPAADLRTSYPLAESVSIEVDSPPLLQMVPVEEDRVEYLRAVEITPETTPEELAKALNMRVEDLPVAFQTKRVEKDRPPKQQ